MDREEDYITPEVVVLDDTEEPRIVKSTPPTNIAGVIAVSFLALQTVTAFLLTTLFVALPGIFADYTDVLLAGVLGILISSPLGGLGFPFALYDHNRGKLRGAKRSYSKIYFIGAGFLAALMVTLFILSFIF